MEISMRALLFSFIWSILVGVCLGAAYDVVRIQRIFFGVSYGRTSAASLSEIKLPLISKYKKESPQKEKKFSKIATGALIFAGDILFCVFAALVLIVFIYHSNDGKARWMIFFGAAAGFAAYYFSIGNVVMFFSQYIVFAIKCVTSYVLFFITFPIRLLLSLARRSLLRLGRQINMKIYTRSEMKKAINASKIGFIG